MYSNQHKIQNIFGTFWIQWLKNNNFGLKFENEVNSNCRHKWYKNLSIKWHTMKILLFLVTNFRGLYKMHWSLGSWIRGFKDYRQQSTGELYFVGFVFCFCFFHHNIVYSKSPVYNNLNGPRVNIKGPCKGDLNILTNKLLSVLVWNDLHHVRSKVKI